MAENDPLDDDDEYELEPVDPEILELERQRSKEKSREAEQAVDIDEVYREAEAADPITWDDLQSFRFTTRHLLITTALLAMFLTVGKLQGSCFGWFVAGVCALSAGWYFVLNKERRERLEQSRRREEVERRIAAERGEDVAAATVSAELDDAEPEVVVEPAFKFSFSMKEMFGALTVAAVTFALVRGVGGPDNAALLLGMVALVGLVVHLIGLDPPPVLVLGWWLLLVLYIIVSLWAAVSSDNVASVEHAARVILASVSRL